MSLKIYTTVEQFLYIYFVQFIDKTGYSYMLSQSVWLAAYIISLTLSSLCVAGRAWLYQLTREGLGRLK
jgi:hypothetical protein